MRTPSALTPMQTAEWLESVLARPGHLTAKHILLDDIPGVEVFYNRDDRWFHERHYVRYQNVYTLRVMTFERNDPDSDADYFFDSFILN